MRPYIDKAMPDAWSAAQNFSAEIRTAALKRGLTPVEFELINVRASQLNGCAFCLDLHARQARQAGATQQRLDLLSAWRDTSIFSERERALLAVAEAATRLPLDEDAKADLAGALAVLGEKTFVAAEWVAIAINAFNRVSVMSEHPVRPRDASGKVIRQD